MTKPTEYIQNSSRADKRDENIFTLRKNYTFMRYNKTTSKPQVSVRNN